MPVLATGQLIAIGAEPDDAVVVVHSHINWLEVSQYKEKLAFVVPVSLQTTSSLFWIVLSLQHPISHAVAAIVVSPIGTRLLFMIWNNLILTSELPTTWFTLASTLLPI